MKSIIFAVLLFTFFELIAADCRYWSGRAPFCSGSCPSNCVREDTGKCGNGACCWTGRKALCNCCGANPSCLCTPTRVESYCAGGGWFQPIVTPLMCRKIDDSNRPGCPGKRTCSTYACGVCIWGKGIRTRSVPGLLEARNNTTHTGTTQCPAVNATEVTDLFHDMIDLEKNMTETDIDLVVERKYGKRLTDEEMKFVEVVRVHPPEEGDKGSLCGAKESN